MQMVPPCITDWDLSVFLNQECQENISWSEDKPNTEMERELCTRSLLSLH